MIKAIVKGNIISMKKGEYLGQFVKRIVRDDNLVADENVKKIFDLEDEIQNSNDQIIILKNNIKKVNLVRRRLVAKMLKKYKGDGKKERFFYWTFESASSNNFKPPLEQICIFYMDECYTCYREYKREIKINSWATLRGMQSTINSIRPFSAADNIYCDLCIEKLRKKRDKKNQKAIKKQSTLKELKQMPYGEYLKSSHWKEKRKHAFRRAWGKCQLCNSGGELHVHHKTYERRGEEWNQDLIVLCRACHARHHGKISEDIK